MIRESITGIAAAQPDIGRKLSDMLVKLVYPVAELGCDRRTSTYVMLDDRDLVAIYIAMPRRRRARPDDAAL